MVSGTGLRNLNDYCFQNFQTPKMADNSDFAKSSSKLKDMTQQEKVIIDDEQADANVNSNVIDVCVRSAPPSEESAEDLCNSSDFTFDNVIGHLENMLIDENFHKLQNCFLEKHWQEFEDSEENKHSYMVTFKEYTNEIENFISKYLKERIINFDMEAFATELEKRKNTLEGEIFEVLLTLSDFGAFKEILLDYRAMKEGRTIDPGESLSVFAVPF